LDYFGPNHEIFPSEAQERFQVFNKRFNKDLNNLPIELNFFTKFYFNMDIFMAIQIWEKLKQVFVKWWPHFDTSKATGESVTIWFKTNPRYL